MDPPFGSIVSLSRKGTRYLVVSFFLGNKNSQTEMANDNATRPKANADLIDVDNQYDVVWNQISIRYSGYSIIRVMSC